MITGDGFDTPKGVVGTELYKNTDPGVRKSNVLLDIADG